MSGGRRNMLALLSSSLMPILLNPADVRFAPESDITERSAMSAKCHNYSITMSADGILRPASRGPVVTALATPALHFPGGERCD
jgi:hypothetical protein